MRTPTIPLLLLASLQAWAGEPASDLKGLSLEELLHVEVTSVQKKRQSLNRAAAAVYVITQDDIRRSGLNSIPELLRLAPGVHVGRINGNTWAISARGFNGAYSNKLLVMVDGRTVYNPLFSGVFWDAQDTLIEDIDRIEVIRGPVAPLWGANAVNGAIHIITRKADQTQGALVTAGGGNEDVSRAGVRYGGAAGANTAYRIYGQSSASAQRAPYGSNLKGGTWGLAQGGFRVDRRISGDEELTVQGDVYREMGNVFSEFPVRQAPFSAIRANPLESSGANVITRWTRRHASGGQTVVQTYYDRLERGNPRDSDIGIGTADVDVQHWFPVKGRHEFMAAGGYRQMWDHSTASSFTRLSPESNRYGTAYLSLVDEMELLPDRLAATLGVRAERSSLSGYTLQPTARLWWSPVKRQSVWASYTRAARTSLARGTGL